MFFFLPSSQLISWWMEVPVWVFVLQTRWRWSEEARGSVNFAVDSAQKVESYKKGDFFFFQSLRLMLVCVHPCSVWRHWCRAKTDRGLQQHWQFHQLHQDPGQPPLPGHGDSGVTACHCLVESQRTPQCVSHHPFLFPHRDDFKNIPPLDAKKLEVFRTVSEITGFYTSFKHSIYALNTFLDWI